MPHCGEILSELRIDKGLTQRELSEILNISNSSISAYETGKRTPDAETIISIAKFFDVTADYLLGLTPYNLTPSVLTAEVIDGVTFGYVINALNVLVPEQRKSLIVSLDCMKFYTEIKKNAGINGVHK
jgi:Predicted transcriptional regulators